NLHEYQARELLARYGIPVPQGEVAETPEQALAIAQRLAGGGPVMVKAQVHAGGRGKAGGVKRAKDAAEAAQHAATILGMTIKGLTVRKVLVVPAAEIATESYAGIVVDRESCRTRPSRSGSGCTESLPRRAPPRAFWRSCTPRSTAWARPSRRSTRWPPRPTAEWWPSTRRS